VDVPQNSIKFCTHFVPSQHPSPQSQIFTSLLFSREQPQAPIKQVFGKSPVDLQHIPVVTVPPESRQSLSCSLCGPGAMAGFL
jgi:hypothetical protein